MEGTKEQHEALKTFDPKKPLLVPVSEIDGLEEFGGTISFKRQTIQDRINSGIAAAQMKKEVTTLDPVTENLVYVLSVFKTAVIAKPDDLDFEALEDIGPIFALYERYTNWVDLFRLKIQASKKVTSPASK